MAVRSKHDYGSPFESVSELTCWEPQAQPQPQPNGYTAATSQTTGSAAAHRIHRGPTPSARQGASKMLQRSCAGALPPAKLNPRRQGPAGSCRRSTPREYRAEAPVDHKIPTRILTHAPKIKSRQNAQKPPSCGYASLLLHLAFSTYRMGRQIL